MRGIVELLSAETRNSAFHATRLDVEHVASVVESLVASAERRFGVQRTAMAPKTVFVSHETYTPARGGSAAAEITALREVFGPAANRIIVANTKGFTGHPMGVGIEDVIGVKILEHQIVPPVPNLKEPDPDLGNLTLSKGGRYDVEYAIHLAAGFGSQIALTLTRRIPGPLDRVDDRARHERWLADVSGHRTAETEVVKRVLRVKSSGGPGHAPAASPWRFGLGPYDGPPPWARQRPRDLSLFPPSFPRMGKLPWRASPGGHPRRRRRTCPDSTPHSSSPAPTAASRNEVVERVLAIVAEKTGYPPDMLEMDLDLEADLGVDTVKQAEVFAAVREAYGIARQESLKLRDFPTLTHVVQFVYDFAPAGAVAPAGSLALPPVFPPHGKAPLESLPGRPSETAPTDLLSSTPHSSSPAPTAAPRNDVVERVLAIVAEKTGYPEDMLEMDLDLEADLGVDTVKQAETFAAVREAYGIARQESLKLRDFPTLDARRPVRLRLRPDLRAR